MSSILYTKGYKYQLWRPVRVQTAVTGFSVDHDIFNLHSDGTLVVRRPYAWDGPSGPTFDTRSSMRASLVHDVGYQMIRLGLIPRETRPLWDLELYKIGLEDGMWKIRVKLWYRAVSRFAAESAHPDSVKKVYTAP